MSEEHQRKLAGDGGGNIVWPWNVLFGGGDNPSPFPQSFRGAPVLIRELVGRLVRIVNYGEVVTNELVPGRVTVFVGQEKRIVEIAVQPSLDVAEPATSEAVPEAVSAVALSASPGTGGGDFPWPFFARGGEDNPAPWPLFIGRSPALIKELIGKAIRIVHYPDVVAADTNPGRVTIFIDDKARIADIWVDADLPTV